jgi:scyllo-inositol 2-dehydrogenase (NADP+)
MKKLNVAIIGQGRSGRDIHGMTLLQLSEKYQVVAVVDGLEERRERARNEYGCDTYAEYQELFQRQDLDLIVNASPSHLHVPITLDCLKHGYNVLCEKPLADRVSDVDLLSEAANQAGKTLAVFQQLRYAPAFLKLREVIESGELGRIVQISTRWNNFARRWDWQTLKQNMAGSLLNTGPHQVDQALQLFGENTDPTVVCKLDRAVSFGDAEDFVKILLLGPGRPLIEIEISSCDTYPYDTYHVQGTQGGLKGSNTRLEWKFFKPDEAEQQELTIDPIARNGVPAYCREELKWYEKSWDIPEEQRDYYSHMGINFYSMLFDSLVDGAPLPVTVEEIRRQVAVMEECHRQNPSFMRK